MLPNEWTPRRRIEELYRRQIMRLLSSYLKIPSAAGLGEITKALSDFSNISDFFQQSAISIASRMATQLKVENARSWREAAQKGSRGREIFQALQIELQGKVGTRMMEIVNENARLISSIPADIRATVNREISRQETEGLRPEAIAKWLQFRVPQLVKNKSTLIARTETSKSATALTRARSEDLGIPAYLWATSEDQRVRPAHRLMDKVIVFWDDPPSPEALIGKKSTLGHYHAGNCPNCFLGDTIVNSPSGIDKIWRASFTGDIIDIFAGGYWFSVTPNHPILTPRGWLAAYKLQEGNDLLQARYDRFLGYEKNPYNHESTFENLFLAKSARRVSYEAGIFAFDFHGDIPDGEVDVISLNKKLPLDFDSFGRQCEADISLSMSDSRVFGQSIRAILSQIGMPFLPSAGDPISTFIGRHFCHTHDISLRRTTALDAVSNKDLLDNVPIHQMHIGDSLLTDSRNVIVDDFLDRQRILPGTLVDIISGHDESAGAQLRAERVRPESNDVGGFPQSHSSDYKALRLIKKRIRHFSGHVYTLQSENGWYCVTPARIISKNCRCDSYPILNVNDVHWPHRVYRNGQITRLRLADFRRQYYSNPVYRAA